jgi:hypothetical protein
MSSPRADQVARRGLPKAARAPLAGAAILLALACLFAAPARADMFTVSDIAVEATAETATEAKQLAIADGQSRAFAELLGRVVRPDDRPFVPATDQQTLETVVAGYSIDNERTAPTQYLADLTVRFNAEAVELLLAQAGIKLAVEQAAPVLIVPVYWTGAEAVIWGDDNPWRRVWDQIDLDNRLVPGLLPLNDATDASVDSQALISADPDTLSVLARRYGVEFAFSSLVAMDAASGRIEGSITGQGPGGPIDLREFGEAEAGAEGPALLALAQALLDRLDAEWRRAAANRPAEEESQTIALGVPFGNLQEWVGIRQRLEAAPGVDAVDVRALNPNGAQIVVTFKGGLQDFAVGLETWGLRIHDNGLGWELRVL